MARTMYYAPWPFVGIRFLSLLSNCIVSGILVYFCLQLKNDGYKLPWTFLFLLIASAVSLIVLIFTSLIACMGTLSPLFSCILNIPISLAWIFTFSLLSWNMMGTLSHSCSIDNWASSDGVNVCHTYKTLYTFTFFGALCQVAHIVLDSRARRRQNYSSEYDRMDEPSGRDIKSEAVVTVVETRGDDIPLQQYGGGSPGWRPGQTMNPMGSHSHGHSHGHGHGGFGGPQYHTGHDTGHFQPGYGGRQRY